MPVSNKTSEPFQELAMIETPILISDASSNAQTCQSVYRIAGQMIVVGWRPEAMEPFLYKGDNQLETPIVAPELVEVETGESLYDGTGWIGNAERHVVVKATQSHLVINIEGIGRFSIFGQDQNIRVLSRNLDLAHAMLTEVVMGLPLITAMAKRNIWMLHGSAATYQGRLAIFLGESGYGKSTMACFMGKQEGWTRVADDILPVSRFEAGICALPHYPQLKLTSAEQPAVHLPERLTIDAIYVIAPPNDSKSDVEIRDLPATQIIASLIGQGVATRIFHRRLLARHFNFCHLLAASVPVRQLCYPRTLEVLPCLRDMIQKDLEIAPLPDCLSPGQNTELSGSTQ